MNINGFRLKINGYYIKLQENKHLAVVHCILCRDIFTLFRIRY